VLVLYYLALKYPFIFTTIKYSKPLETENATFIQKTITNR